MSRIGRIRSHAGEGLSIDKTGCVCRQWQRIYHNIDIGQHFPEIIKCVKRIDLALVFWARSIGNMHAHTKGLGSLSNCLADMPVAKNNDRGTPQLRSHARWATGPIFPIPLAQMPVGIRKRNMSWQQRAHRQCENS